ncbi:type II toxin-antitoxin system RelE/ParE family toxin [uncultured Marinimicrobium sp.]|jgi:toxin ParE1/3/4|uniref:type II toxin-antitoxin system RelE/ParE family toxin n=1 Tax=uncultured Marinimicrobium sp. TaxID=503840 RepID=UPI0030DA01C6|tara:strand:+ start:42 stop:353 length:312 start_codon:yes stop_codon:yes gene_type:complete
MNSKNAKTLKITPRAKHDLQDIWTYGVDTWGEQQADIYFNTLFEAMEALALNPGKGHPRPELLPQCSSYVCKSHTIYYRTTPTTLEILGILHQRMDVMSQLDQ